MKKDPRTYRSSMVNGVVAVQNPDRHRGVEGRKKYCREHRKRYRAEGALRRQAYTRLVCERCWKEKDVAGEDGLGGFGKDGNRRTGWAVWCKACVKVYGRPRARVVD